MLYQQIARNKRKTVVVMAAFVIILTLVGAGFGYLFSNTPWTGILIALIGSLIYLFLVSRDPCSRNSRTRQSAALAYHRRYGNGGPRAYAPRFYH